MAEKGQEGYQTLVSDKRGQSLKKVGPLSRNRSSWRCSSTSFGGDLRQLLNRGANWKEEPLSPPDWQECN